MKATVKYNSGLQLVLDKQSNAPLLFLEWLAKGGYYVPKIFEKVVEQDEKLMIRLWGTRETYDNAAEYINLN